MYRVALALAACLTTFFILEIGVRVFNVPPAPLDPLPIPNYQLSANPVIGFEYQANYTPDDPAFDRSHLGHSTNHEGFRDYPYSIKKPTHCFRTIVLGDSTTAGNGIQNVDKTYTKKLEQLLSAQSDRIYEVLNMGVGGYHTMQEAETLRSKGLKYEPDLVILTFCSNDFILNADGGVYTALYRKNPQALNKLGHWSYQKILKHSRLAFILHYRLGIYNSNYYKWYDQNILNGKTPVAGGFALLSELQRKHKFQLIVLILPVFEGSMHNYKYHAMHKKVYQAAEPYENIEVIDLLNHFSKNGGTINHFSYDSLHMTEQGHATLARILQPVINSAAARAETK